TVVFGDGVPTNNVTLLLSGDYTDRIFHFTSDSNGSAPGTVVSLSAQQPDHWIRTSNGNWNTAFNWSLGVPTATIYADVDATGTYSVAITTNDIAYGLLVNAAGATVTDNGGTLTLAGTGGSNGALNINAGTFVLNGGALKAGSISIASGGTLSIAQSYTL